MRGDIDDDPVRIPELVLGIGRRSSGWPGMIPAAIGLDLLARPLEIIDPQAEVMQPDKILPALVAGIVLVAKLQEREVDYPVGQPCGHGRLGNALEPESLLVEF